jgi:beta-lactamase superfamily II metal-dependent hydrolase
MSHMRRTSFLLSALLGVVVACSGGGPEPGSGEDDATASRIKERPVSAVADVTTTPPTKGHYRIHLIDIGSGLAILVQGNDFTMLFDGGSGDDASGITSAGNKSRLLAYLFATLGPSGDKACAPKGDHWTDPGGKQVKIDHVFLSHPHDDHVASLDEVVRCYDVKNIWEPGMGYDNINYGQFIKAASEETGLSYHTAVPVPADRSQSVHGEVITMPQDVTWTSFAENDTETLGAGARFKILHTDTQTHKDNANLNSLVVRVDLGRTSLLLMGDAMAGTPSQPVDATPSYAEAALLHDHAAELHVDIFQVGHHGSETSTRSSFLQAVKPAYALLSAGPRPYSGSVLPDQPVVDLLTKSVPHLLRTDVHDKAGCPTADRIGMDDGSFGGCDNHILEISP